MSNPRRCICHKAVAYGNGWDPDVWRCQRKPGPNNQCETYFEGAEIKQNDVEKGALVNG